MKNNSSMHLFKTVAIAILILGSLALYSGCDSGGGGSDPAGTSTVRGNVSSFTTGTALFLPTAPASRSLRFLAALGDLLVPPVYAGVAGVDVYMVGTDLHTTTADDGFFIMSGVPSGKHQMRFSFNGTDAYWDIDVPDNATITLSSINCRGSSVSVGHMDWQNHMGNPTNSGNQNHMGNQDHMDWQDR